MKVLFVCLGNTCRSPMAHAWLNHIAKRDGWDIEAESGGTWGYNGGAQSYSRKIIKQETGKDLLASHRARKLDEIDLSKFDHIITMEKGIKEDIPGKNVYYLLEFTGRDEDVNDPYGGTLDTYRSSFEQIREGMDAFLKWLKAHSRP